MTQTVQLRSLPSASKEKENLDITEPETEDNVSLLLKVFDSLNNLSEKLIRLEYVLQRKNIETTIHFKSGGDKK